MNISRRAAIATLGLSVTPGCSMLSEQPCKYACVNLTGGWIAGVCKIGKVINDYIASPPLTANQNSARTSILSGYRCEFTGQDSYSKEPLELEGKIPRIPFGLENPYLLLYLERGKPIICEWKDLKRSPRTLEIAKESPGKRELQTMLVLAPKTSNRAQASFRQRPEPFGAIVGMTWTSQPKGTVQNSFAMYIAPATKAPQFLLCFLDGDQTGQGPTWRTIIDLRNVPQTRLEDTAYWLETEQDGAYRLGRFNAPSMDETELLHLYADNKLPRPTEFLTGQAERHPRYKMLLYRDSSPTFMPDLRFPDELKR